MPLQRRQDHHRHALAPDVTLHLSNNPQSCTKAPVAQMPATHTVGGAVSQGNTLSLTTAEPTFFLAFLLVKGKVPPHQRQPNSNTKVAGFRLRLLHLAPLPQQTASTPLFPFAAPPSTFDTSTGVGGSRCSGGGSFAFAVKVSAGAAALPSALLCCPTHSAASLHQHLLRYSPNKGSRRVFDATGQDAIARAAALLPNAAAAAPHNAHCPPSRARRVTMCAHVLYRLHTLV